MDVKEYREKKHHDRAWWQRNHRAVHRKYGKAYEYLCEWCDRGAVEWAWVHDTNPEEEENYIPLCQFCHRKYDKPNLGGTCKKRKLEVDEVLEIKRMLSERQFSPDNIAFIFDVTRHTVYDIKAGRTWSHV